VKTENVIVSSIVGGFLLTTLDFFLEQLVERLDFWYWTDSQVLIQNYISWFVIGFFLNMLYQTLELKTTSKIGAYMYILLLVFLVSLSSYY
jgi:putative membrane protein